MLHAAVERFGAEGFDASLRAIARDAGLSASAIIKCFGSKEELRRACDEHLLAVIRMDKAEAMRSQVLRGTFLEQVAMLDEFQPLVRYMVRSLLAGGEIARTLVDDMHVQAEQWMRHEVEAGHVKPSRDEAARVKLTLSISLGWMLQAVLTSGKDIGELDADFWKKTIHDIMLPALELYTEGLLTDRTLLDEYLLYMSDPPAAGAASGGDEPVETTSIG